MNGQGTVNEWSTNSLTFHWTGSARDEYDGSPMVLDNPNGFQFFIENAYIIVEGVNVIMVWNS